MSTKKQIGSFVTTVCLRTNGSDGRTAHPNGRQAQPVRRGERVRARGGGANLPVLAQEPGQVRHLRHSGAGAHLQRMRSGVCECAPISDVPARFPDRSPARALGASTRDPSVMDTRLDAIRVTTRRLSRPRAGLTREPGGNPNHPIFIPFKPPFGPETVHRLTFTHPPFAQHVADSKYGRPAKKFAMDGN